MVEFPPEFGFVVAQADQRPAAMHALAVELDFQLAFGKIAARIIALRRPGPIVPKLHRAAAILALRYGALEGAIFQRVIFDLDGQPLRRRVERGDLRHRPGFVDAVELEAEIVMEPRRGVALNDEAQRLRLLTRDTAARLRGDAKVAFGPIGF